IDRAEEERARKPHLLERLVQDARAKMLDVKRDIRIFGQGRASAPPTWPSKKDQGSTSASSIRLPNGSAKNASLRLMAGRTNGSVTILTPRARSLAIVSSTLTTLRQKWW